MNNVEPIQEDTLSQLLEEKLLVSGLMALDHPGSRALELRRGMTVQALDGKELGAVAAVMVDCSSQLVTQFLLGHVPPTADYHLVPLNLIDHIQGEIIWLSIGGEEIETLPVHQTS